jgi:hypothetical protein
MFERTKIAERLWAQAAMCDEAAQFYPERIVATHLKRLAEYCRDVAFIMLRDEPDARKH